MGRALVVAVLVSAIVAGALGTLGTLSPRASAAVPPPASGDWIVDSTTVLADQSVVIAGNVSIESGAILNLTNVNLSVSVPADAVRGIVVKNGGGLFVGGGNISLDGPAGSGLYVLADYGSRLDVRRANLTGFGFTNATANFAGVIIRANSSVLADNVITSETHAVSVTGARGVSVTGNTITAGEVGIALLRSTANTVEGNSVAGAAATGIWLNDSASSNVIRDNYVEGSGVGIFVDYGSASNSVENNTITGSTTYGVVVRHNAAGNLVSNNSFTLVSHGIWVGDGASNTHVWQNDITAGTGPVTEGVLLSAAGAGNLVHMNSISGVKVGIAVNKTTTANNRLLDNTIIGGTIGILVNMSSGLQVTQNTVNASLRTAIQLEDADGLTVSQNVLLNSSRGIVLLYDSDGNSITGNVLTGGNESITLWGTSSGNTVTGNTATDVLVNITDNSGQTNTISDNDVTLRTPPPEEDLGSAAIPALAVVLLIVAVIAAVLAVRARKGAAPPPAQPPTG